MNRKRLKVLFIGVLLGVVYAFLTMLLVQQTHLTVSIGYIFGVPVVLGALPVLLSTENQLKSYMVYMIAPWLSTLTFFYLSFITDFEGLICLVIIIGPFLILGCLAAFFVRLHTLKTKGDNSKKLYISLSLPLIILLIESFITPNDYYGTVTTKIIIDAPKEVVWENIKNVKDIDSREIETHFIHQIGIPKPLNGELNYEGVGGIRHITWEKGLSFNEKITHWDEGNGFSYDIIVNPDDIPPKTLDEHVMIGGKYFDAVRGGYKIRELAKNKQEITLTSTYRITSTVNLYGQLWTDFIFDDFHHMILEVIKKRCEI